MSTVTPTSPAVPTTISNLAPIPQPIGNSDVVAVVQNGTTYKATAVQLAFPNNIVLPVSQGGTGNSTGNLSALNATATGATTSRTLAAYFSDVINVLDFGAVGNGVADDTVAIKAAVAAANAAGGGIVLFSKENYLYTSSTATIVGQGVTLMGTNPYGSVITTNNAGANIFNLNGAGASCVSLGFASSVANTSGIFILISGIENYVSDFHISGDYVGIQITGVATKVSDGWFGAGASGAKRIIILCGDASPKLHNILYEAQSPQICAAGLSLQSCTALTATQLDIIQQGNCLEIIPGNGQLCLDNKFIGCFFDSGNTPALIEPTGTGAIARTTFDACWTGDSATTSAGLEVVQSGSSVIEGLTLIGHEASVNTTGPNAGISLNGVITGVNIIGGTFAQNTGAGIYAGHTGDITIIGAKIGAYDGFPGNTTYGIDLGANLTSVIIQGCSFIGNTSGAISDGVPNTVPKFINNNIIPSYAKAGTISVGSSPFTYTAPYDQTVYTTAGTVSGIVVGSTTLFAATGNSVTLRQGESMVVTYSSIPTMTYTA